jgi:cyclopropane fatty-acyl-phospholipid synthase-like methyltransferase
MNPFLTIDQPAPWGPGSFEMALPLIDALGIQPGMRVLEIGGGSGQIATTLARHFGVTVVTLEPWTDGSAITAYAEQQGVANQVLSMRLKAQSLPFAAATFDAAFAIGSFEMIGEERPQALTEVIRVLRRGGAFGIAEPMCLAEQMPDDLAALDAAHDLGFQKSFRTLAWNRELFQRHGLEVRTSQYFPEARTWWLDYRAQGKISPAEQELIWLDQGRWLSLGMVVGVKP